MGASPNKHASAKLQQSVVAAAGGTFSGPRVQQERQLWMQLIELLRKRCVACCPGCQLCVWPCKRAVTDGAVCWRRT